MNSFSSDIPKLKQMNLPDRVNVSSHTFLKFIAYLQVIGIVLVVLGHSFHEYPDDRHGATLLIYRLIYNFHMPLFMFVSGFLMFYTTFKRNGEPSTVGHFTIKKSKRLILPYVILTLVTYIPRAQLSYMADDTIELSARGMVESIFLTEKLVIPYFWFIQASFLLLIFCYAILSLCHRYKIPMNIALTVICILSLAFQIIPINTYPEVFSYRHAINFSIYFILGAFYCQAYSSIDRVLPLDNWPSLIVFFFLWISTFLVWENSELSRISSLFGIAMCISFAKLLVRYKIHFLDHLIGANYIIFLLSWYFNILSQQILAHYIKLPWWIYTILSLTFGIYVPWLAYLYLRNNQHRKAIRVISTLLGQSFKR